MEDIRKQELIRLLEEALKNLEVRVRGRRLSEDEHEEQLRKIWSSPHELKGANFTAIFLDIQNENIKSQLREFIKNEFSSCMSEHGYMRHLVFSVSSIGVAEIGVDCILFHLLHLARYKGVREAVDSFERSTQLEASLEITVLLGGLAIDTVEAVTDGVTLYPLSSYKANFKLPPSIEKYVDTHFFTGGAILVIDATISPVFHEDMGIDIRKYSFEIQTKGLDVRKFKASDLYKFFLEHIWGDFSYALSLSCNKAVQVIAVWPVLSSYDLWNRSYSTIQTQVTLLITPTYTREIIKADKGILQQAIKLYEDIRNRANYRIPIYRWVASKTNKYPEDRIIDLSIALEAIYLFGGERGEIAYRLALRAARYLRGSREQRKRLFGTIKKIYKHRSKIAHGGRIKDKKLPEFEAVIKEAQNLCRESILKILEEKVTPKWNDIELE